MLAHDPSWTNHCSSLGFLKHTLFFLNGKMAKWEMWAQGLSDTMVLAPRRKLICGRGKCSCHSEKQGQNEERVQMTFTSSSELFGAVLCLFLVTGASTLSMWPKLLSVEVLVMYTPNILANALLWLHFFLPYLFLPSLALKSCLKVFAPPPLRKEANFLKMSDLPESIHI